jgi:HK97 family phage major capsid protein
MELTDTDLAQKIETLTGKASELVESLPSDGSASTDAVKAIKDEVDMLSTQLQPLVMEQQKRHGEAQIKAITTQVAELSEAVKSANERARLPEFASLTGSDEGTGYHGGEYSVFKDIKQAREGGKAGQQASERLAEAFGEGADGKANSELTDAAGGYLVNPQRLGVYGTRERLAGELVSRIPSLNINTDSIELVKATNALAAGWVADLATKVEGTSPAFSLFNANVFTVAGLAVASNQLLEDSSIDRYLIDQLTRRVNHVIETGVIAGTGTGQPLGILGTAGVQSQVYTDATPTVVEFLPHVAQAIAKVQDVGFTNADVIIMRPQLWTQIITAQDTSVTGHVEFVYGSGANDPRGRQANESIFVQRSLFGVPVVLSMNIPTNLGAGTNESRAIVASLQDDLFLNRSGLQVDKSEHVYFTSNQTVFRAERRVGFTAGVYPASHVVISGTGLINTFA